MTKNLDQDIVDQLKEGKEALFRTFYLKEQEKFIAWCQKELSLTEEEARDAYQEAQMYLYENIVQGRLDQLTSQLSTYLYSVAKNQVLMKFRKQNTVLKHEDRLNEHLVFLKGTEELGSDKAAAAAQIKREIDHMLEPCKSLLKLFYYESLSFKDIAQRLGYKNDGVAKNQKKRCLDRLRKSTQK
ncbi:RNA polymerase sigma factor, sigma-70 family [Reichenbachiella faecimaris]|uniref:RNA polymerase sigma factor, sigma-70 family n=1 Tax=Reichenbachiella faecimaris TaxID=692418 RepID=A0A1W2GK85_REIFA|nr:sigma-70 family RNA polymerase sigma factor [Reichenbachiella faecimaris]SMD36964.1 RNA polymerase sigma factor, sigma-70 family [Reichenbachiella faecimaris]